VLGSLRTDVETAIDGHGIDGHELEARQAPPELVCESRFAGGRRPDEGEVGWGW
jgi:hypothetical protein